jgi:nucleoside-diphosphate-sugar epimerase
MYGPVDGPLREDLPLTSYGRKPALRSRITRMWMDAHAAGRVRVAAVRPSDFYGPGVRGAILGDFVTKPAVSGAKASLVGDPRMPHTFTYMADVVRALVDVADAEDDVYGQAWHVPSAPARPVREVVEMIYREAGRRPRMRVAPPWMVALLGILDPTLRELRELMYEWTAPYLVDHSKFAARFWSDYTPLEVGIPETVRWFAAHAA